MSSSPYRGGMPKNSDSGGSSSETEGGICLTVIEKKLRSSASQTKSKVLGMCGYCSQQITGESQRVEIAVPDTVLTANFVLKYESHGVVKLHSSCWKSVTNQVEKRGRRRYTRKLSGAHQDRSETDNNNFSKVERCLLKEVAGSAEFYDPMETVGWEAIRIARLIKSSKHCIVFTGAGISTAAGIGDYRGKSGKWTSHDLNDFISDMSLRQKDKDSEDTSEDNDGGVDYENLRPTYTHEALKVLLDKGFIKYIISQNGDGLHKLSGIPSGCISELHGNVFEELCEDCGARYERDIYTLDDITGQYYDEVEDLGKSDIILPKHAERCKRCGLSHRTGRKCARCGGHLIDTIINFGDLLEDQIVETAEKHAVETDLVISLGSTMAVTPANGLVTRNKEAGLVICNRQKTDFDTVCDKRDRRGVRTGSRVYSDCDVLMKCVMSLLLNTNDLISWEGERSHRLQQYDTQRRAADSDTKPSASRDVKKQNYNISKGKRKSKRIKVKRGHSPDDKIISKRRRK